MEFLKLEKPSELAPDVGAGLCPRACPRGCHKHLGKGWKTLQRICTTPGIAEQDGKQELSWETEGYKGIHHLGYNTQFEYNNDRTSGNGFKLAEGKFTLNTGKKFFPVRVLRLWHRKAVAVPESLKVTSARLGGAWSKVGQRKV